MHGCTSMEDPWYKEAVGRPHTLYFANDWPAVLMDAVLIT